MNIYLLSQSVNRGWDTYNAVVVVAENEDDARTIHPSPYRAGEWWREDDHHSGWATRLKDIEVELIGVANKSQKRGVILASFNAG